VGFLVRHCHRRCTRKNYHVNNKYKMELINYPIPCRERCAANDGDTAVAAISIVRNERGRSLIRPVTIAVAVAVAFAAAVVVSRSTTGCCVDASASHPLDSASAS
jgi:hypothetical protein